MEIYFLYILKYNYKRTYDRLIYRLILLLWYFWIIVILDIQIIIVYN